MVKIGIWSQILSNFLPIKVTECSTTENPILELYFYKGQWQLATQDAIYSDGTRYRPLLQSFQKIEKKLKNVNTVLVLGAGLGSAAQILSSMNFYPEISLLDIDLKILEWAKELMKKDEKNNIQYINSDAFDFIKNTPQAYDLIVADIFKGRAMPSFIEDGVFLNNCKTKLSKNGIFILNYMIATNKKWEEFQKIFLEIFPKYDVIKIGINRVLIATL